MELKVHMAHKNQVTGEVQSVEEHSRNTAELGMKFAIPVLKNMVYIMGMLHDIGKYQPSYQRRIRGENIMVEHSGCGALEAKALYPNAIGLLIAYCIAGHHSGIPDGGYPNDTADMGTLWGRLQRQFEEFGIYKNELQLPKVDVKEVTGFMMQDCEKNVELLIDKFAFLTRYCFSCLTDADSMDTASFCTGEKQRLLTADFQACLRKVNERLSLFECTTSLQKTRALLQQQVFDKVAVDAEIYLMNMPTGSGKTLCSVKFALERVIRTGKKRIIYIIPYNSIVDQTMQVFQELFGNDAEILRHQSTFSYEDEKNDNAVEDYAKVARSATENWNVTSIIVTTAVQFFESVYANKRGKLRKLHNMADSVLIFDEAHLMPQHYLQPCLQAVVHITKYLGSEAVFLTATMPDFRKLIQRYALNNSAIIDLVQNVSLFSEFRKCEFRYVGEVDKEEILAKTMHCVSSLIIVNTRQTARELYQKCSGKKYHLSTYMTSVDRKRVIEDIRIELKKLEEDYPDVAKAPQERRITIISTSLIEAGVDLDVYTVFRELAGLDSILQAGGRCNREGKRKRAEVIIFEWKEERKRTPDIKWNLTKGMISKYEDISCPQSIQEYYDRLFFMKQDEIQGQTISGKCSDLYNIPFSEYAKNFEIIDSNAVSLVVPGDEESQKIVDELKYTGGGMNIGRKLQKYTCSVYKQELDDLLQQHVVEHFGTGIWCLTNMDYYDEEVGILFEARDYFV